MAFGVTRHEVNQWKEQVKKEKIAFLTHYWYDPRFPKSRCVTKVGCSNLQKLINWGKKYELQPEWIDHKEDYPHFDLLGERQYRILRQEGFDSVIEKFKLSP